MSRDVLLFIGDYVSVDFNGNAAITLILVWSVNCR